MKLKLFDGGLNTRVAANLIAQNEARRFVNIDSDTAVLAPVKDKTLVQVGVLQHVYYSDVNSRWYSTATPADYVEYQGVLYRANRIGNPVRLVGDTEYALGVAAPVGTLAVAAVSAPKTIARVTLAADYHAGSDLPAGTYKYKIINKSSTTGYVSYSYYAVPTEEVLTKPVSTTGLRYATYHKSEVTAGQTRVTITIADTNADLVRVYRYFDGAWRALTPDFQSASIAVVDGVYNISANAELVEQELVTGSVQYAVTFYSSATGAESKPLLSDTVEVANGAVSLTGIPVSTDTQVDTVRIYRIGGNLTAFSLVTAVANGTVSYSDTTADTDVVGTVLTSTNNDVAPTGLKYLVEAYAMLFGAIGDKLRFTPIGNPTAWPSWYFLDFPATITGISRTAIGLLVHTYYKTYLVTGTGPTSFAQQILSNDQGCVSHDSISETKDTAIWVSTDGICASDGSAVKVVSRDKLGKQSLSVVKSVLFDQVYQVLTSDGTVLALDFERGIFKQFDYGVDWLTVANDMLHGHDNGSLYSLGTSQSALSFAYESPEFDAGSLVEAKVYDSVKWHVAGEATIEVFVDGALAGTYASTKQGLNEIKLPQLFKRGQYISFKITGTGTVQELEWTEASANA